MNIKYMVVFILMLVCLTTSTVFASDMNETITLNEDSSEELVNIENNTVLQDSYTFSDLRDDINGNPDNEINLTNDYSYSIWESGFDNGVLISRSLTINGNGHTLDGKDMVRIFQITDNSLNVVLKDIIFIYGKTSGNGGAISGKCTVINCTFKNNVADKGGALYKASAINCTFENNNANDGGAIFIDAKNINIENCTFENNVATETGGAISIDTVTGSTITNCTFKKNKAKNGGSLSVAYSQKVSILNSEFIRNEASVDGGAIHYKFALHNVLNNCYFENNAAEQHGGAVAWILSNGNITHNRFKHNTAKEGNGGAIYIEISNTTTMIGNQVLTDCDFSDNSAQNGGALYCGEFYRLNEGVFNFTGNSARDCGGAVYCTDDCKFTNSIFSNNEARDGGALYCNDYCDVYLSKFINNNAGDRGGAIFSNIYTFLFDDEFKNNAAHNGGALYCSRESTISKAQFTDNTANYQGGAVYCDDHCSFYNVKFNNNKAYFYGGAVYCSGNNEFFYTEFRQNNADYGPAIYALGSSNIINNTLFLLNKQEVLEAQTTNKDFKSTVQLLDDKYHFNAVYSAYDIECFNVTYWNGKITNTNALDNMGAPGINVTLEIFDSHNNLVNKQVYTTDNNGTFAFDYFNLDVGNYTCKITHEDDDYYSEFSETYKLTVGEFAKLQHLLNLAKDEGIVNLTQNYTYSVGYDTLSSFIVNYENLTINGNGYTIDALNHGTSFSLSNMKNVNFLNCTFKNGINFNLKGDNVLISNCNFNNIPNLRISSAKTCQIIGCNFNNSNPRNNFAACDIRETKNVFIKNSNFTNIHHATFNEGAIYLSDNNMESIIGCNFINNTNVYGGAIHGNKLNNINLINCTFENNSAKHGGAAILPTIADGIVNIDGCVFINNTAERGGALDVMGNVRIKNSIFLKNKALSQTFNMNANLDTITINFAGSNNFINAIYSYGDLSFDNVTYWDGSITNTDVNSPVQSSPGVNITIKVFDKDDNLIFQTIEKTDKNGKLIYNVYDLPFETKYVVCYHEDDDYYARSVNVTSNVTRMGDYDRLQLLIDEAGENGVVTLTRDYTYSDGLDSIKHVTINHNNITINGNGHSISGFNKTGMIYSEKDGLTLNNITFIDGHTTLVYLGANTQINDCNFLNNYISSSYANIWLYGGNLIVKNTNFINTTTRSIELDDGTTGSIYDCNFINNTCAIFAGGNSFSKTIERIFISGSNFVNNSDVDWTDVWILKAETVIIENSNFTNNKGPNGGAIRFEGDNFNITNCTFTGNIANDNGGAIYLKTSESNVKNCNFFNNSANHDGGAIYIQGMGYLNVYNSVFTFNKANDASAIYYDLGYCRLFNSTLLDNKAKSESLGVDDIDSSIIIKFTGNNVYAHAIYNNYLIEFHNVTYWNGEVVNSDDVDPVDGQFSGVNITLEIRDSEDNLVENITLVTDEQNAIYYYPAKLGGGNYSFKAYHLDDNYYSYIGGCEGTFKVNRSESSVKINIENGTELYYPNFNITFNITNKTSVRVVITNIDGSQVFLNQTTQDDFIIVDLDANEDYYNITVYNIPSIKYFGSQDSKLFKISKIKQSIIIDPIPDVYYNNTFNVTFDGENFETVNVTVVDVYGNIVFNEVSTNKSVTIPVLPVGTYNITVSADEYRYYSKASNSTKFNILQAQNNVVVTVENVTYGNVSVIVVSADVDGVYAVDVNGTISNITVVDKRGNITLSLDAGKYYANATYGDGNYSTNVTNAIFEVYKAINNVIVSVENVTYGGDSVVIVKADVDGVYTVDVNGTVMNITVTGNQGSVTLSLGAGKYYANATYGDGNYSTIATNAVFEVYKAVNNGRIIIQYTTYGRETEIIVTADIDGVYAVDINGTFRNITVINNIGFFRVYFDVGSYYANATFDNGNYSTNITNATFEIQKARNNVVVSVENVTYGNESIIEISANANGVYTVDVNGTLRNVTVENYRGYLALSLGAGKYYANVTFDNVNYSTTVTNATFEVYKALNHAVVNVTRVINSQNIILEVTADVDGVYTLDLNGTVSKINVVNGNYFVSMSLPVGKYYANVTFENGNYSTVSSNVEFEINEIINNVKVIADNVTYGNDVIIKVVVDFDGVYTLDVNGSISKINVVNGSYSTSLSLGAGKYYANVTFYDGNYSTNVTNAIFEVYKAVNNVVVIVENVTYGNKSVVVVSADVDGVYAVDVNGTIYNVAVVDHNGNVSLSLDSGTYYANATFDNGNYSTIATNAVFEVYKAVNNVVVIVENVTYGNKSVVVVSADVDGVYAVDVNGTIYNVDVVDHNGNVSLSLAVGKYYANVTFEIDNYVSKIINTTFEVYKAVNNVVVSVGNVTYGNKSVVVVSADVDGVYAVDVNGTIYNVDVVNHNGNVSLSLAAGKYYANATYSNSNYSTVITNASFEVYKAVNNVVVSVENVTYGEVSVVVVSADVDGVYTLDLNGNVSEINVVDGKYSVSVRLPVGKYYANVTFDNGNYSTNVINASFEVYRALNNVVVSVENVSYGEESVVVVSADVDGVYSLDLNGNVSEINVVDGKYSVSVRLPVGKYYANMTFDDGNYTSIITNASFEVYRALNNVVVSVENVSYGEASVVVVSADVDGVYSLDLNGNVSEINVVDGKYSVSVRLPVGKYYVNVTFDDGNYSTVVTNASFEVYKAINNVQVIVRNVDYGKESMIIVSADVDGVYSVDVNGTVTNVTVEENVGSFTLSLGAGRYYANATFESENYISNITNASFEVYKAVNNVRVIVNNVIYGEASVVVVSADVDGVYTLDLNGNVSEINVVDGKYSVSVLLPVGKYYANVTFDNGNYSSIVTNASFEVYKAVNNVKVIVNSVTYGEESVVVVSADVDGVYTLDLNGETRTIEVVDGNYSVSVLLPVGKYYANVTFDNGNYTSIITNATFEVYKAVNNVKVIATVDHDKNVNLRVVADVDGVYTLDLNGTVREINVVNGNYLIVLSLPVGKYYANVTFDNGNYTSIITNATFEVSENVNNVKVIANSVTYGKNVVLEVLADVDGEYTLDLNGTVSKINVVNGKYSVSLSLPVGKYYANVTFDNTEYTNIVTNATFEVYKAVNNVRVIADSVAYGKNVTLRVVADVDGVYVLDLNGETRTIEVVDGKYSVVLSLPVGKYYANVTFNNGNYSSIVTNASFEVYKAVNNVRVIADSVSYGKNVTVRVVADVDGVYILDLNGNVSEINVVNGSYSVVLSLPVGKYYANVTFNNGNYSSIVTNASFEVYKAVNNVRVIADSVSYGKNVTVRVVADVDGVYILDLNGNVSEINVVNGSYSVVLSLPVGKYYANVTFENGNYSSIITNASFEVYKAVNNVKVTVDDVNYGKESIIIVSTDVDGVYTLDINGNVRTINVVNGKYTVSLLLDIGDYYANVSFADPNYNSIISNATFKVLPAGDYDMTVEAVYDNGVYVFVILPELATGNVTLNIDGKNYTAEVNVGIAFFSVPDLNPGDYNFTILYSGDKHFASKVSNSTVHVKKVLIDAYDAKYGWANSITYSIKLIDEDGNAVWNKEVLFYINGQTFKSITNANGVATVTLSLKIGSYDIQISYLSESVVKKINVVSRFSANKNINMYYYDGSKYTFKVYGDNGNLVGANQNVVIKLNKKSYTVKTDKNGVVSFTIPNTVKIGTYTITATYKGQTIKNTVKVKQILTSKKTVKVKRTAKKLVLKAKLKKKLKGKKITFKFKGKKYVAKTNKKGIAKVTIKKNVIKKLKKGKSYKVTVSYYKMSIKTKIKVK